MNMNAVRVALLLSGVLLLLTLEARGQSYDQIFSQFNQTIDAGDYKRAHELSLELQRRANTSRRRAAALNSTGRALKMQGQNEEAERFYRQALQIRLPSHDINRAWIPNNLALALIDQRKPESAAPYADTALREMRRIRGNNHLDTAAVLQTVAIVQYERSQLSDSARNLQTVLSLRQSQLNPDHFLIAKALNLLGRTLHQIGDYQGAEEHLSRAAKIQLPAGNEDAAFIARNLGSVYFDLERVDEAEVLFRKASDWYRVQFGPRAPERTYAMDSLASICHDRGDYTQAEQILDEILDIRRAAWGEESDLYSWILVKLGHIYWHQGRLPEAEAHLKRGIEITERRRGPQFIDLAYGYGCLAQIYKALGRVDEARVLCEKCLEIQLAARGEQHVASIHSLGSLAEQYDLHQQYDQARRLHEKRLELTSQYFAHDGAKIAAAQEALAAHYVRAGEFILAEQFLRMIVERHESNGYSPWGSTLCELARVCAHTGRFEEAEQFFNSGIAKKTRSGTTPQEQFHDYLGRARVRWQLSRHQEALADLTVAVDLAERQRTQAIGAEQDRSQYFCGFLSAFEQMVVWQVELGNPRDAFEFAEQGRARFLVDQMEQGHVDLFAGMPPEAAQELRSRELKAKCAIAELERKIVQRVDEQEELNSQTDAHLVELNTSLDAARKQAWDVYREICSASPAFQMTVESGFKPVSVDQLQAMLKQQRAVLLEYVLTEDHGYCFVIEPNGEPLVVPLELTMAQAEQLGLAAGPLTRSSALAAMQVEGQSITELLASGTQSHLAAPRLALLWELFIPSAVRARLIANEFESLVIAPDGPLASLPFDALVIDDSTDERRYLLDAGPPIHYTPSATVLWNLTERPEQTREGSERLLTVGDVAYAAVQPSSDTTLGALRAGVRYTARGGVLKPLPGTALESQWFEEVFKSQGAEVAVLRGTDATEAQLRASIVNRQIVHLACHGLSDDQFGNYFGALALSTTADGQFDPANDGFLTLPEIYGLDLSSCELAILSACQTNRGPQQQGEGVWALSRAFLVAGARRVVASNWPVEDASTAALVRLLCEELTSAGGNGKPFDYARALHKAKQSLREQGWESPFYWAPFVLVGPR